MPDHEIFPLSLSRGGAVGERPPGGPETAGMAQPVRWVEARRVGFVYSAGWGGGEAAIIGMLNGRDICIVFTTLRETNDGNGGPLAR